MKRFLTAVILIAIGIGAFFWFRKTAERKPLGEILIVGTSADFPPFSFRGSDDSIVGFDIDIIKEVAQRLSKKIDLQDKPFGTLLPQLELGQIHVIAAGMTPTAERAKRVHFTKPYLSGNPLQIVTPLDAPVKSLEDLKGKTVIVNTGYTADIYMQRFPDITLLRLPKVADAINALEHGKADAFVTASLTLQPYLKEDDKRFAFLNIEETNEQNALGFSYYLPKAFLEQVQKVLDDMEADGTLTALKKKWKVI